MQSLEKSKTRKTLGITAVEGEKEIEMAMAAGMDFQMVFYQKEIADTSFLNQIDKQYPQVEFINLSRDLFAKLTYRETTGGMIAVIKTKTNLLKDLKLPENPLVLIIEAVEKPGNLGAILRTADAAKVDAVICCHLPTDIYNPNIIRASLGTVFTVPLATTGNDETMEWLKAKKITTYCTNLHKAEAYYQKDYNKGCAIVMGTEATGVSDAWIQFADANIKIPMLGKIDSMNVSVAAAIVVYEARRQRLNNNQ
ncbi:MAG: RNA methyltransferase [Bacteroidota bacterium]